MLRVLVSAFFAVACMVTATTSFAQFVPPNDLGGRWDSPDTKDFYTNLTPRPRTNPPEYEAKIYENGKLIATITLVQTSNLTQKGDPYPRVSGTFTHNGRNGTWMAGGYSVLEAPKAPGMAPVETESGWGVSLDTNPTPKVPGGKLQVEETTEPIGGGSANRHWHFRRVIQKKDDSNVSQNDATIGGLDTLVCSYDQADCLPIASSESDISSTTVLEAELLGEAL